MGFGPDDAAAIKQHEFFETINWDELKDLKVKPPFKPKIDGKMDLRHFDKV